MNKRIDGHARGKCTQEVKLKTVRVVKGGLTAAVTTNVLGIPMRISGLAATTTGLVATSAGYGLKVIGDHRQVQKVSQVGT